MNREQKTQRKQTNQRITFDMTKEDRIAAMRAEVSKRREMERMAAIKEQIKARKAKGLAHYLKKMGR